MPSLDESTRPSTAISQRVGAMPTLVAEVSKRITADIENGVLQPGARLPTEREMMSTLGVSRTVIREAVAQLRAGGLVKTRQGLGAFVSEDALVRPLVIPPGELKLVGDLINLTELRMAFEVEAAALAAERATLADIKRINAALDAADTAIKQGEAGAIEDFRFHKAVALATGNPHFPRMIEFLGQYIIPRHAIPSSNPDGLAYLARIQSEHWAIFSAISNRDPQQARDMTRAHLSKSRERLDRLQKLEGKD